MTNFNEQESEEVSVKEIILKFKEFYNEVQRKWIFVILGGLLLASFNGAKNYFVKPTYPASLTFMINEDSGGGGLGGAAALLGQFGFGGSSSEYNLEKIIALGNSNKILHESILESNNYPALANKLIEVNELHKEWEDNKLIAGYTFSNANTENLERNEAIRKVTDLLRGTEKKAGLISFSFAEETGIMKLTANTPDPELSLELVEVIYDKLANFYIKEAIEKPMQNFRLLKERADSVALEIAIVDRRLAEYQDKSKAFMLKADQINLTRMQRKAQILTILYGEVIKNKETANFILKSKTPFFQEIDQTALPIEPEKDSLIISVLMGLIVGSIVSAGVILLLYIYRSIME